MPRNQHKIAHILPWPSIGGVELATLRIAQAVESERFKNIAFSRSGGAPIKDMFASAGFETVVYEAVEPSYRHPKTFLQASLRLAREFKRRNIDLIHCSDLLAGYHAGLAGRLARVPVLCHVRCVYDHISRRDSSFLRAVNKFVFVSNDTWRRFDYAVSSRDGAVVYDGIDVQTDDDESEIAEGVRREFGVPSEAKVIGMVGRIAPAKDYETLIKAAARVIAVHPEVRFLLVGDYSGTAAYSEHYHEVQRMLSENGVAPYFIFTGFREDVPRFISAMDCFVLSTHMEGLPLAILEAMGHAKPVIATAVGGIPEIVLDGKTGLLYSHQNDEQLASHILSVLKDEKLSLRLGESGREFVRTNFNRSQFTANMMKVYREILCIKESAPESCPVSHLGSVGGNR